MFRVEGEVGYSFNTFQINRLSDSLYIQCVGFGLVLLGLFWAGKDQIKAVNKEYKIGNRLANFF
jgi:hypothetical protein